MWLHFLLYICLMFFIVAFVAKAIKYSRMPIHLRWELYPVAHEVGHESGGSYLEEVDWWSKARRRSVLGELKYMAREGLLFEKCYHNNRGLWYFTYPFHIGLFLLLIWLTLLLLGALLMIAGVSFAQPNTLVTAVKYLTLAAGGPGLIISAFGCAGLLIKRLRDENLKPYTARTDYFNLSLTLAILLSSLVSWLWLDPLFDTARGFTESLVTFSPATGVNPAALVSLTLFSIFLVYMPFTMMHGLAKYFTYHRVAWDDEPNVGGGKLERKVQVCLMQPVNWSAPHTQRGKTWSEIASTERR